MTPREKSILYIGLIIVVASSLFSFVQASQDESSDGKAVKAIFGIIGIIFVITSSVYLTRNQHRFTIGAS